MTSITWAGPRYVQELGAFLGPENPTQRGCVLQYLSWLSTAPPQHNVISSNPLQQAEQVCQAGEILRSVSAGECKYALCSEAMTILKLWWSAPRTDIRRYHYQRSFPGTRALLHNTSGPYLAYTWGGGRLQCGGWISHSWGYTSTSNNKVSNSILVKVRKDSLTSRFMQLLNTQCQCWCVVVKYDLSCHWAAP